MAVIFSQFEIATELSSNRFLTLCFAPFYLNLILQEFVDLSS